MTLPRGGLLLLALVVGGAAFVATRARAQPPANDGEIVDPKIVALKPIPKPPEGRGTYV